MTQSTQPITTHEELSNLAVLLGEMLPGTTFRQFHEKALQALPEETKNFELVLAYTFKPGMNPENPENSEQTEAVYPVSLSVWSDWLKSARSSAAKPPKVYAIDRTRYHIPV